MTAPRPLAADVLASQLEYRHGTCQTWGAHIVAALRAAVEAGPDDTVCLLPDGTLSVAEPIPCFDAMGNWETEYPAYRIPGTEAQP